MLWSAFIWLLHIDGMSITTKRNLCSECIFMAFMMMLNEVGDPYLVTIEPSEHSKAALLSSLPPPSHGPQNAKPTLHKAPVKPKLDQSRNTPKLFNRWQTSYKTLMYTNNTQTVPSSYTTTMPLVFNAYTTCQQKVYDTSRSVRTLSENRFRTFH